MRYMIMKYGKPGLDVVEDDSDDRDITHCVECIYDPNLAAVELWFHVNSDKPGDRQKREFMMTLPGSFFPQEMWDTDTGTGNAIDLFEVADEVEVNDLDQLDGSDSAKYSAIGVFVEAWCRTGPMRGKIY